MKKLILVAAMATLVARYATRRVPCPDARDERLPRPVAPPCHARESRCGGVSARG